MSIDTAVFIAEELKKYGIDVLDKNSNIDFQVHMDIGTKGATAEFISELEGWVTAYSFKYKIKPESYASSTIADKLSKWVLGYSHSSKILLYGTVDKWISQ